MTTEAEKRMFWCNIRWLSETKEQYDFFWVLLNFIRAKNWPKWSRWRPKREEKIYMRRRKAVQRDALGSGHQTGGKPTCPPAHNKPVERIANTAAFSLPISESAHSGSE